MKRMVSLVGVCGLVLIAGFAAYKFDVFGVRGRVVKKNIEAKIDDWLGKEKVQLETLNKQIEDADKGVETLLVGRVRAQRALEKATKAYSAVKTKPDSARSDLKEASAKLDELEKNPTSEVSLGGTSYNLEAVKKLVADRTAKLNAINADCNEKKRVLTDAERTFNLLKSEEEEGRKNLEQAKARKDAVEAKMKRLEEQREAARLLSSGKQSTVANFDEIDKTLNELEDQAEVNLRIAEEKAAIQATKSMKESNGGDSIEDIKRAAREALGEK